jgi:hypothetical protein
VSRVSARTVSLVLAAVTVVYLLLIAQRAWRLITTGEPVAVVLGVGILALPAIGVWVLWREIEFGLRTSELGRVLEASGGLPEDDLPRRPSGRVVREAADERFAVRKQEVEQAPDDWGAWFRLAVAYDDAGDRRRARATMRTAIERYDTSDQAGRAGPSA